MAEKERKKLSRRGFLILLGTGTASLVLGVSVGLPFARQKIAEFVDGSDGAFGAVEGKPTAWFEITPENQIIVYLPKVEMGQGVHTALAQIAIEELEASWDQVEVRQAGTGQGLDDSVGTSGSSTVSSLYQPLREAGALMRVMLIKEASTILATPVENLKAEKGWVHSTIDDKALSYGEIVRNVEQWEIPDEVPPMKSPTDFKFIGKSIPRVDLVDKVTGAAIYGYDKRLPDMVYGAVARPPVIGAKLIKASEGKAKAAPGVVSLVLKEGFAGVVAETRVQAREALKLLDLEWEVVDSFSQEDIENLVSVGKGKGVVIQKEGSPTEPLNTSQVLTSEFRIPMAFHAHLEPQAAVADVRADKVEVWVSTQAPVRIQEFVAEAIDRDKEEVRVVPSYLGGGFGRKVEEKVAVEAAILSDSIGKPVHVGWTREEDFQYGYLRPPTHHVLRGVVNSKGKIEALEHQQSSGQVSFPFLPKIAKTVLGADFGSWRGAMIQYGVPNKQTITYLADLPIPTGWWRGLGLFANIFAIESFIDELAFSIGMDPLEFRLLNMPETKLGERMRNALIRAKAVSDWTRPAPEGVGRGVALALDAGTVVVEIAEVRIDNNRVKVDKVFAVVDPGMVISPDGAKAQVEGALTMGLSSVLYEEAIAENGLPSPSNFDRYPLLSMRDTPDIHVELIQGDDKPHGLGEPPIGPIGAAVANALFYLTGERLRTLPFGSF
ncbi:MAG: molybdopterin-dependent oxidoreductase [Anaerolineales bacterium]